MVHAQEKALTLKRVTAAQILPFVMRAGDFDTTGGAIDLQSVAENGHAFLVLEDGKPILGYTLEVDGGDVTITAAAGWSKRDLTVAGLRLIEAQAENAQTITFHTRRAGLVRKAKRLGYRAIGVIDPPGTGTIMRKNIQ